MKQVSNLCYGEAMVGAVFPVANAQLTYHCADCIKTKVQTVMNLTKVDRVVPIITNDHIDLAISVVETQSETKCVGRLVMEAGNFY